MAADLRIDPARVAFCGFLGKLGGNFFQPVQRRFFVLECFEEAVEVPELPGSPGSPRADAVEGDFEAVAGARGRLSYFASDPGASPRLANAKGILAVDGARIVDRGTYRGKPSFSVETEHRTKGHREYFLFADSQVTKSKWVAALMFCCGRYPFIASSVTGCASPYSSADANLERLKSSPLAPLLALPENQFCSDCRALWPTWAVVEPFGVFVCIECIGVHRHLWSGKCKEIQLDSWSEAAVAFMHTRGNRVANAELEFCCRVRTVAAAAGGGGATAGVGVAAPTLEAGAVGALAVRPGPSSSRAVRERFIRLKYEQRAFLREAWASSACEGEEPTRTLPADDPTGGNAAPSSSFGARVAAGESPSFTGSGAAYEGSSSGGSVASSSVSAARQHEALAIVARAVEAFSRPPKYSGVVFLTLRRIVGMEEGCSVVVFTNGYQEVKSASGKQAIGSSSVDWNQPMQIALDLVERPLYATVLDDAGVITATGEFYVQLRAADDAKPVHMEVPLWGKKASSDAALYIAVTFTRLT